MGQRFAGPPPSLSAYGQCTGLSPHIELLIALAEPKNKRDQDQRIACVYYTSTVLDDIILRRVCLTNGAHKETLQPYCKI